MAKNELSFRPTVLVAIPDEQQGEGLIDAAHMEGLIMQKCSGQNLYYCNAIMVRTGKESGDVSEKYYKIQDKVFFKAFSVICQNSQFCTKETCIQNDATAAEYVLEHTIEESEKYKQLEKIIPVEDTNKKRLGIRYICPQTKLDEIAFPVRLYDRQMGVLIVGQISDQDNRSQLETCVRQKMQEAVEQGEDGEGTETAESVLKRIRPIQNKEKLQELIDQIIDIVDDIEKGLIEHYEERQNQYIFTKSNELIEKFKSDIEADEEDSSYSAALIYPTTSHKNYYTRVGTCIKTQLNALCDTVGIKNCKMFIPQFEKNLAKDNYDRIEGDNGLIFCFDHWKTDGHKEKFSGNLGKYISGIAPEFDLLLVADTDPYPIALAVAGNDFLAGVSNDEKELLQWTFSEVFKKFAEYSQMAGLEAKSDYFRAYLDSYMSIQRHELGQSNSGYRMLIDEFKTQRNMFYKETMELGLGYGTEDLVREYLRHSDNFISDSEKYLDTTMIRVLSTKYLIDFSVKKKTYFYPYEAFLFKWNHIYDIKANSQYLRFVFPQVSSVDIARPQMYGDPLMIEQAAYNLTNNAIKYAIQGTAVSLDCQLNKECNRYEITVENLGLPLKNKAEKEEIFQFGKRGSNNEKEGNGLGLFLTKQIAKVHGGDVICETKELSKYNWGLIQLYIKYYENKNIRQLCKDENLYYSLKKELTEKEGEISRCIVHSIPDTDFTPMYVHQNILSGTARFKFTFWIPHQK